MAAVRTFNVEHVPRSDADRVHKTAFSADEFYLSMDQDALLRAAQPALDYIRARPQANLIEVMEECKHGLHRSQAVARKACECLLSYNVWVVNLGMLDRWWARDLPTVFIFFPAGHAFTYVIICNLFR